MVAIVINAHEVRCSQKWKEMRLNVWHILRGKWEVEFTVASMHVSNETSLTLCFIWVYCIKIDNNTEKWILLIDD